MLSSVDLAFPKAAKPTVRDVVSKRSAMVKPLEVKFQAKKARCKAFVCFAGLGCEYGKSSFLLPAKELG